MRNGFRFIGMAAVAALSLTAMALQDGIVLKRTAKVGDVEKFRIKAEMDFKGTPITYTGLITEKVVKVGADGEYTIESLNSEGKVAMSGTELDASSQGPGASTSTFKANGEIVSISTEQTDPNLYRMANLQSLQFPTTPVKVGSTWEIAIAKSDRGAVEAKGTYKIEAQEKVGEFDCYRIHGTMKEAAKDGAGVDATYWVDVKTASLVKLQGSWTKAPFPGSPEPLDAKVTLTREN
jgi:hypothetical protein